MVNTRNLLVVTGVANMMGLTASLFNTAILGQHLFDVELAPPCDKLALCRDEKAAAELHRKYANRSTPAVDSLPGRQPPMSRVRGK